MYRFGRCYANQLHRSRSRLCEGANFKFAKYIRSICHFPKELADLRRNNFLLGGDHPKQPLRTDRPNNHLRPTLFETDSALHPLTGTDNVSISTANVGGANIGTLRSALEKEKGGRAANGN
jgi:hypothetical protein